MHKAIATRQRHGGFALVLLLAILVSTTLYFVVGRLTPSTLATYRAKQTERALAQARDALLGYAVRYRDLQGNDTYEVYGYLPLPDLGSTRNNNPNCKAEGCNANNFYDNKINETTIGRFPWRGLGVAPLRDGYGECLWLIVSGGHQEIQRKSPMNWDTLGQLDIVTAHAGSSALVSLLSSKHERPVAIIVSAGTALAGQDRGDKATDDVSECGGNYDVTNYLAPWTDSDLAGVTNYFAGSTNNAYGDTEDKSESPSGGADATKSIAARGSIQRDSLGKLWANACPAGTNCGLVANDQGLAIMPDELFGAIRKNANFRTDINSMLDRIVQCLRDAPVTCPSPDPKHPNPHYPYCQIPTDSCYAATTVVPRGYFANYHEMLFMATNSPTVNGQACASALLFANQRTAGQKRISDDDKKNPEENLEGINAESYSNASGSLFSGQEELERVSPTQTISQDIVRCIPTTPSFLTVASPGLTAAGKPQLANYDRTTRTLTLGTPVTTNIGTSLANYMYGCAWQPETHVLSGGLRAYFNFRINDAGFSGSPHEGFTFSIVDGDNNGTGACGAAAEHLGYSGNNTELPFIAHPKVGIEFDLRRLRGDSGLDPTKQDHLSNGRNDPPASNSTDYRGGHVATVYWGGEMPIPSPVHTCSPPRFSAGSTCYLPQEEDDNVHGIAATTRTGFSSPPANPSAPMPPLSVPPDTPVGFYKLDPTRTSIPVGKDIHIRVELTRAATTDFQLPQVRVASIADIDLDHPGALIDGVYLFAGDRVLLKDQTNATENGVYVWQSASRPMHRALDANTSTALSGLMVEVRQGPTHARSIWRQNAINPVIGTDTLTWTNTRVKVAAPATISISAPGTTLDGIRMQSGDRVFVTGNGVYVWHSATTPMTLAPDIHTGSIVQVQQGSEATAWWKYDGSSWQRLLVRSASSTTVNLANPGSSIGGVILAAGDRVLLKNQQNAAENGIYVWTGSATSLGRAADADSVGELAGALTQVREGDDAGRAFRQTSLSATGTLDADPVLWSGVNGAPRYLLEVWILTDSGSTDMLNAMQDTTRSMSVLYPSFIPQLRDSPVVAYPFRNVRLGFTTGQRTTATDQTITVKDTFTTWLP